MREILNQLLPAGVFALMLVFCRTGTALMLLPGFGDLYVPQRWRLLLGILLAGLVAASLGPALPPQPATVAGLFVLVGGELVVGFFLGTLARLVVAALDTAGMIVSLQLGLSAATIFNPAQAQQGAITGAFLSVLGILLLFATDTHLLMLHGLVGSYEVFRPGVFPDIGDLSDATTRMVGASFQLGVELAAPLIVVGTVFYGAMGILSRLMPQLQIFFIVVPLQVTGGLVVFAATLYAVMDWFLGGFTRLLAGPLGL